MARIGSGKEYLTCSVEHTDALGIVYFQCRKDQQSFQFLVFSMCCECDCDISSRVKACMRETSKDIGFPIPGGLCLRIYLL